LHCFQNRRRMLQIDQSRGDISVYQPLDYEATQQHTLTIMARDQGLFFRNATVVFVIHVTDVNDNAPIFNNSNFCLTNLGKNSLIPDTSIMTFVVLLNCVPGLTATIKTSYDVFCS
jgi:hypothetical protein